MTHRNITIAALCMALLCGGAAIAQVTQPAQSQASEPAPPPPPPLSPLSPPATSSSSSSSIDAPRPPNDVEAPVLIGRIETLLTNPNGDVDGLLLEDGTQVNFPPHLSAVLLQVARVGDTVSVHGLRGYGSGAMHATAITNVSTGRSVTDQPSPPVRPPPPPSALTALTANGHVARLLHADMGEVNGVLLDDGTIVRFPPQFGSRLHRVLQPNVQLTAIGYGTQNAYGRALEATSVAINGQAAVSVYGPGPDPGSGNRVLRAPPSAPAP